MVNLSVVEQLLNHINRFALCKNTDKILLAVSGGLDSMVMLHLMRKAGFHVAVAHCNFQLRGLDSNSDEDHVREACEKTGVQFHSSGFNTQAYAMQKGISVQMAARDLRYNYFQGLLESQGFDYLATAHHLDDTIETIFLNLIRGTGIQGLTGIPVRTEKIIRPLLFATRKMLVDYAIDQGVRWREDSSNLSDDYQRNFFRHQIIPKILEINPNFQETFRDTQERLAGAVNMNKAFLKTLESSALQVKGDIRMIDIEKINESPSPTVILWEFLKDLGFNFDQCRQISQGHQAGKLFYSHSHKLLIDRQNYLISKKTEAFFTSVTIDPGERMVGNARCKLMFTEASNQGFELRKNPTLAQVDADLLHYPLTWRTWQAGDYFMPLGMRQEKKLSDFLIDLKMPFNEKADVTVLESGGKILWVVGFRISEGFKVTPETQRVLIIEQAPSL